MPNINYLEEIQSMIGDIETWPSEIINYILVGEYNCRNIFRVISFFYGNCAPVGLALSFYTKYNNHSKILALCHFTLFTICGTWTKTQTVHVTIVRII